MLPLWLSIYIAADPDFQDANILLAMAFIFALLNQSIKFLFQKFLSPDRIVFGNDEIMYLGDAKSAFKLDSIKKISLNGWTNKIAVQEKRYFEFKKSLVETSELVEIFHFIDQKIGLDNIEVTDNLKGDLSELGLSIN